MTISREEQLRILRNQSDEDIQYDHDAPATDADFWKGAKLQIPKSSLTTVTVQVDSETLAWFQSKGKEAEHHMTTALKMYAEQNR